MSMETRETTTVRSTDCMIKLYSAYKESLEKKSMGFLMSEWDAKLLKYGEICSKQS